jgi:hypothetical protein
MPAEELADQSGADEELVAHRLGVGRVVAQGRDESLGPTHDTPPRRDESS